MITYSTFPISFIIIVICHHHHYIYDWVMKTQRRLPFEVPFQRQTKAATPPPLLPCFLTSGINVLSLLPVSVLLSTDLGLSEANEGFAFCDVHAKPADKNSITC